MMFCFVYNSYCNHPFYKLVSLVLALTSSPWRPSPWPWPWDRVLALTLEVKYLVLALTVVSLTPSLEISPSGNIT